MPIVGTNCETMPVKRASGSEYGMPRMMRKTSVNAVERNASTSRELMKPETFTCVISHRWRTVTWLRGASHEQIAARNFGPAAHR